MVHVGFYDEAIGEGIYESHLNYFIAATGAKQAKKKAMNLKDFKGLKMHVDGIKEISNADGYDVILKKSSKKKVGRVYSYNASKKL